MPMMRTTLANAIVLSGLLSLGCGGSLPDAPPSSKDTPKVGPHGGTSFALPNDLGYAEVVNEPQVEGRGDTSNTSVVVYILTTDAKRSAPIPLTDVKFVINAGTARSKTLTLKPEPKPDDPAAGNRFVSETGPYRIEEIRGELTADAAGTPVKIIVAEGR